VKIIVLLLSLFWSFLLFMTGARFLLLLFNVDKSNEFVHWILTKSDFWVKPFFNLFGFTNKALTETGGFIEPASLIAFIVYLVVGAVILAVVRAALYGGSSGRFGRRRGWGSWREA
jgi:hypothetical protein